MNKENKSVQNNASVLDNARGHFKSALAQDMMHIDVPEWNATIYFKAATSFAVEQKIIELHAKGHMVEALVETLLNKALLEDGKKMFAPADKIVFMREVDPEIIIRVVAEMNEAKTAAKEALGN